MQFSKEKEERQSRGYFKPDWLEQWGMQGTVAERPGWEPELSLLCCQRVMS